MGKGSTQEISLCGKDVFAFHCDCSWQEFSYTVVVRRNSPQGVELQLMSGLANREPQAVAPIWNRIDLISLLISRDRESFFFPNTRWPGWCMKFKKNLHKFDIHSTVCGAAGIDRWRYHGQVKFQSQLPQHMIRTLHTHTLDKWFEIGSFSVASQGPFYTPTGNRAASGLFLTWMAQGASLVLLETPVSIQISLPLQRSHVWNGSRGNGPL